MVVTPVIKRCLYLAFAQVPQLCCGEPFPMEEEFSIFREADDIVLFQAAKLEEQLIVIVPFVHDEGSLSEQGRTALNCGQGHINVCKIDVLWIKVWKLKE